jgi:hypothetical protein
MTDGDVHTVYRDGTWTNTIEGADGPSESFNTKEQAVAAGREIASASRVEHHIHRQDGAIGERNSYGNDPADRPG